MSWLANISPQMIQRASERPGSTDVQGQLGGQQVVDQRDLTAQDEADRARYADRYRAAYRECRRAMGYDEPQEQEIKK